MTQVLRLLSLPQEEAPLVHPPLKDASVSIDRFFGQARASLLSVGIIQPVQGVSASQVKQYLEDVDGAPLSAGKIAERDFTDVARFLNRYHLMVHSWYAGV
jgi:hypothetical protein